MFDYFVGGQPAGTLFKMKVADLHEIVKGTAWPGLSHRVTEVCFIGLMAYFEAFCKDHFASLINICPQLLESFKERGNHDVTIDSTHLLSIGGDHTKKLGFLLSERYDFGTARRVNSLYSDLIMITPFSKDEKRRYDKILNDRNLLVHHGGTYTLKYAQQLPSESPYRKPEHTFWRPLFVNREGFLSASSLLTDIVYKTCRASDQAIDRFINSRDVRLSKEAEHARDYLRKHSTMLL